MIDRAVVLLYFSGMDDSYERTVAMKGLASGLSRSFVIEIMWNYPHAKYRFYVLLAPALDRLILSRVTRKEATQRQLESGNTNPALAPMCIGAVARVEEGEISQKTPLIKRG